MKALNFLIPLLCLLFFACKKDKSIEQGSPSFTKETISGLSQKGPFLNGSSINIYELDENFSQTGKTFNTQILDNSGAFTLTNMSLLTSFVKFKADGFYFNEISNANSSAPISLFALSDLSNKSTVNINLLSSLEVSRIEYLLSTGLSFNAAKKQAQKEVLDVFFITKPSIQESELLDISQNGDDNAILLAVSLILQGYKTEAQLTQLLGDINTDIRTDGILNSIALGSSLINDSKLLNLSIIRSNIENKYSIMGITAVIPDFEKYIHQFNDSCTYVFTNNIQYPFVVNSKQNILSDSAFIAVSSTQYSVGAYLPSGTKLKVVITLTPGSATGGFGTFPGQNNGWTYTNTSAQWNLQATGANQTVDIPVMFTFPGTSVDIAFYENNSVLPTRVKTVHN